MLPSIVNLNFGDCSDEKVFALAEGFDFAFDPPHPETTTASRAAAVSVIASLRIGQPYMAKTGAATFSQNRRACIDTLFGVS